MASQTDNPAAFSGLQEGALVLADISGYSKFIAQTEVDHSWAILHELLDTIVRSVHGRMDVSQVEGDAILFITGLTTPDVISAVEKTFVDYHRRLRDMKTVTTCPCNACANIGILKLKFVVHHGKFSRQRIGPVEQLHGADVIVAHRLLKNSIPSKEYLLVTDAVLERLPEDRRARFTPHSEDYDLGAITGGYEEIAHLWEDAQAKERKRVLEGEAMLVNEVTVDAPLELVDRVMLEPDVMQRYLFAESVDGVPGARGTNLDGEFHCHHGDDAITTMRVVSIEPGQAMTITSDKPTTMYITTLISDAGDERTKIRRLTMWEEPPDADMAQAMRGVMETIFLAGDGAMQEVFAEKAGRA